METLTTQQARDIADFFLDLSDSLGEFRTQNKLSASRRDEIISLQLKLLNESRDFTAMAINIKMNDLKPTLQKIADVTSKMNDDIKKLKDAQKVIGIATSAILLGTAIATGNPIVIATALDQAVTAVA